MVKNFAIQVENGQELHLEFTKHQLGRKRKLSLESEAILKATAREKHYVVTVLLHVRKNRSI
jgi:hypothetical protein